MVVKLSILGVHLRLELQEGEEGETWKIKSVKKEKEVEELGKTLAPGTYMSLTLQSPAYRAGAFRSPFVVTPFTYVYLYYRVIVSIYKNDT